MEYSLVQYPLLSDLDGATRRLEGNIRHIMLEIVADDFKDIVETE